MPFFNHSCSFTKMLIQIFNIRNSTYINFFSFFFQYWFQNRRARSKKLTKEVSRVNQTTPSNQFVNQTTPSNQFEPIPDSRFALPRRLQFVANHSGSDHWKHATCVSYRYGLVTNRKDQQYSRFSTPARHQPSVQLNRFSRDVPCPFTMSNSGQSKITHAQLARSTRRSSRISRGFHPYWMPN